MAFGSFGRCGRATPTSRTPDSFMMPESFKIDKDRNGQVEAVTASARYKMRNELWKEGNRRANCDRYPAGKRQSNTVTRCVPFHYGYEAV